MTGPSGQTTPNSFRQVAAASPAPQLGQNAQETMIDATQNGKTAKPAPGGQAMGQNARETMLDAAQAAFTGG
ncbi:hypothetical protein NNJEOMEG_00151 [Fundidesulfovibrio magnetotacticus]|uniref:SMP domain-containing protein n=1 Tax=Fundidesulfovibrio magnetotacticus TaxID=2730080 RepID=A0A6V8LRU7_9BACT|nr:hypothetical protein [Fundidesulfovibrio magnetotacticus]GFK92327.1 hypothetical protein NNJEOMEG_00151 [Fundidesulfovibrio magnetotacticus]